MKYANKQRNTVVVRLGDVHIGFAYLLTWRWREDKARQERKHDHFELDDGHSHADARLDIC